MMDREKIKNKPTKPVPLILRERFVMIVSRSSGWLSRHGKPLLRFYEWHPAVVLPSLSLSLLAVAPPSRSHERNEERAEEKGEEREMERREWKTRDGDAYNYLAFMYARKGSQSSFFFQLLPSAFTRSPSPRRSFFLFLSFSRFLAVLAASRARFSSFSFSFFFARSVFFLSWLELEQRCVRTRERARDEHEHGRTDGQARMHTGKPKRSARE